MSRKLSEICAFLPRLPMLLPFGPDEGSVLRVTVGLSALLGDRVLATPPARGLNLLIYILPPLAILAGGIVLYRVFRNLGHGDQIQSRTQPEPDQPGDSDNGTEDLYVRQFEKEYLDSVEK